MPEIALLDETATQPVLDIQGLSVSIGGTALLSDITCQLQRGHTLSVVGPSGSGKSTFLRCLNRLEHTSAGTVHLNGVHGAVINNVKIINNQLLTNLDVAKDRPLWKVLVALSIRART